MLESHFEKELSSFLDRHFAHPHSDDQCPPNLAASMRYSLLAPGKRIRPRLVIAAGKLVGIPDEAALRVAMALEIIHCFTLIHDDLPCMDNSDTRRGLPSNHKKFGDAVALLAGDALLAMSLDAWTEIEEWIPASRILRGLKRFSHAAGPRGVCGGQAAEALLNPTSRIEELRRVHAQKTGALFAAAIMIPCDLSELLPTDERYRALDQFSKALGLAFQIMDDLEDAEQDRDPKTGEYTLTSILRYQPREQAARESETFLQKSCQKITLAWKNDSAKTTEPLLDIAQEVLKKLR